MGVKLYLFEPPIVYRFVTLYLEISEKTSFHPWKFCKVFSPFVFMFFFTTWKFQSQKPRTKEQYFFLNTTRNFSTFLIDPCNFHMLFPPATVWIFSHLPIAHLRVAL